MTVVDGSTMVMSIKAEVSNDMAFCRSHRCRVGGVRRFGVVASKSGSASLVVINGVAGIDHMSVQQGGQNLTGDEIYMILRDGKVAASSLSALDVEMGSGQVGYEADTGHYLIMILRPLIDVPSKPLASCVDTIDVQVPCLCQAVNGYATCCRTKTMMRTALEIEC